MTRSIIVAAAVLLALSLPGGCGGGQGTYTLVPADGEFVRVDLTDMESEGGAFFTYVTSSGRPVDFLVSLDSRNLPTAFLDACRSCYRWKRGYAVDGEYVTCRKCGERFTIDSIQEGRASCVPVPLYSSRRRAELFIPVGELESAVKYF